MNLKQSLLAGIAMVQSACAGVLGNSRAAEMAEVLPPDTLCTPEIMEQAEKFAAEAEPIGEAYKQGKTTTVVYNLSFDDAFTERFGADTEMRKKDYGYSLQDSFALLERHADLKFIPADDAAAASLPAGYQTLDVTFSGGRDAENRSTLGKLDPSPDGEEFNQLTYYVAAIADSTIRHQDSAILPSTITHELLHYLLVRDDRHAEDILDGITVQHTPDGKEFLVTGTANSLTTSFASGYMGSMDKEPEIDLCATRIVYGAPQSEKTFAERVQQSSLPSAKGR